MFCSPNALPHCFFLHIFEIQVSHFYWAITNRKYNKTEMALNSSQNCKTMVYHLVKVLQSSLLSLCPMWVQSGTSICFFVCLFICLFVFSNEYTQQFIDTMHCRVSPLSYTINVKTILPLIWSLLIHSISLL